MEASRSIDCERLVQRLSEAVLFFDESGALREWNAAAAEAMGYDDPTGTPADELLGDGIDGEGELITDLHTADGRRVPYQFTLYQMADGAVAVGSPSERLDDEQARHEILERMSDGFFVLDREWRVTYANPTGRRIVGAAMDRDPEAVVGANLRSDVSAFDDTVFYERYREAMESGEPASFEARYGPLETWFDVRAYPFDGGLYVYFHDVTDHHRQRDALERREGALREMYEVIADRDRPFEEQVRGLLELGRKELDIAYGTLSRVHGDEYTFEVVAADDDSIEAGDVVPTSATNCEIVANTERSVVLGDVARDAPDQVERAGYAEWGIACYIGAPVYADDEVYGTFCFYDTDTRDVFSEWERTLVDLMSGWVSYELGRQEARRRLEEQSERMERFAGIVSHDLRNPLNVTRGYLELAEETGEAEHFERCVDALDRMNDLIEDLLVLSREGAQPVEREQVSLRSLAEECWRNVETGEATLAVDTDRTVSGSPTRLRQVFENLIRNAVEHGTPEGGAVTVTVGELSDGFYIEDDGVGIPVAERETAFEHGYTTDEEGTGFGLAIVAAVADAHGWETALTAGETGGARFKFRGVE